MDTHYDGAWGLELEMVLCSRLDIFYAVVSC